MIKKPLRVKAKNRYGGFLPRIQQLKMKELWDNKDDDGWGS